MLCVLALGIDTGIGWMMCARSLAAFPGIYLHGSRFRIPHLQFKSKHFTINMSVNAFLLDLTPRVKLLWMAEADRADLLSFPHPTPLNEYPRSKYALMRHSLESIADSILRIATRNLRSLCGLESTRKRLSCLSAKENETSK